MDDGSSQQRLYQLGAAAGLGQIARSLVLLHYMVGDGNQRAQLNGPTGKHDAENARPTVIETKKKLLKAIVPVQIRNGLQR